MTAKNHLNKSKRHNGIISNLLYLAYPELCMICGTPLNLDEKHICSNCLFLLPKVNHDSFTENQMAERFYGKISFSKATSGFHYQKESSMQKILEAIKYKGEKELGEFLGSYIGARLSQRGFFDDIDLIVPVPLHPDKKRKRGYNQSEWIAKGLSKACGSPSDDINLKRTKDNLSQTRKSIRERSDNVESIFAIVNPYAFEDKHVLLVDDVVTSGATLESCGQAIIKSSGAKVSFFALAMA